MACSVPSHYLKQWYIDGLVQERRNSSALAMELRLSCTNPSILSVIIITPLGSKLQWNLNPKKNLLSRNSSENVVCTTSTILSRHQCDLEEFLASWRSTWCFASGVQAGTFWDNLYRQVISCYHFDDVGYTGPSFPWVSSPYHEFCWHVYCYH